MLKFMLITGDADVAEYVHDCGVERIFVDLEQLGKAERQPGDTVKSQHTLGDVARIRSRVPKAEVLTRIDPLHSGTREQIEGALDAGTDLIMLPMWRTVADVEQVAAMINGRCRFIPLCELPEALRLVADVLPYVDEIYLGLNDLRIARGGAFLFEPLAEGEVDEFARNAGGKPFGFGGIARVGGGLVDGGMIVREHVRLGSSMVILSRDFHNKSVTLEDFQRNDIAAEVKKVRDAEAVARTMSPKELDLAHEETAKAIRDVAGRIRAKS